MKSRYASLRVVTPSLSNLNNTHTFISTNSCCVDTKKRENNFVSAKNGLVAMTRTHTVHKITLTLLASHFRQYFVRRPRVVWCDTASCVWTATRPQQTEWKATRNLKHSFRFRHFQKPSKFFQNMLVLLGFYTFWNIACNSTKRVFSYLSHPSVLISKYVFKQTIWVN